MTADVVNSIIVCEKSAAVKEPCSHGHQSGRER